jgi:hypothetical protein
VRKALGADNGRNSAHRSRYDDRSCNHGSTRTPICVGIRQQPDRRTVRDAAALRRCPAVKSRYRRVRSGWSTRPCAARFSGGPRASEATAAACRRNIERRDVSVRRIARRAKWRDNRCRDREPAPGSMRWSTRMTCVAGFKRSGGSITLFGKVKEAVVRRVDAAVQAIVLAVRARGEEEYVGRLIQDSVAKSDAP